MSKELKGFMNTISNQMENIDKEMEIISKNQIEILELESIITEVKNHWKGSTADLSRQKK